MALFTHAELIELEFNRGLGVECDYPTPIRTGTKMNAKQLYLTTAGRSRLAWLGLLLLGVSSLSAAPEPWADRRLPVTNGLAVWLDASRQNAARQPRLLPLLLDGGPVDLLFDASGNRIDLVQRLPEARPHFKISSGGAFIRFDGKDDSLAAGNLRVALTNTTLFVVAAPRSNAGFFRALLAVNAAGRNDYTSGLTLDLGGAPSSSFSFLNAEGAGFQGVLNLLTNSTPFGEFHTVAVACEAAGGVRAFRDGVGHSRRNRTSRGLPGPGVTPNWLRSEATIVRVPITPCARSVW